MFWGTFLPGERSEMIALRNREAFEQLLYDLRSLDRLFQPGAVPVQCCACLAGRRSYAHATRGLSPNESSLGSGKTQGTISRFSLAGELSLYDARQALRMPQDSAIG